MITLQEISEKEDMLASGHRLCAGCGASIIVRQVLLAARDPIIVSNATCCLEVSTSIFPFSAWKVPWIHSAFENASATISGVETAYRAMKKKGKITKKVKFIAFGGDGGTYDIGIQSLSGALERGHSFLYICYDNEAYMNTGIQRSGATPLGAMTTTSPAGRVIPGKKEFRKDLTKIVAAHGIPYVAQASPSQYNDLMTKVQKALSFDGPTFINVISPCPRGWRHDTNVTIAMAQEAVDTCFWPLFEIEKGTWKLTSVSKDIADGKRKKLSIEEWLKKQGRFKHLFEKQNYHVVSEFQTRIDHDWAELMKLCGYPS
jgi:pyruvate ferredoxin oxidoreductase beta subunit